MQYQMQEQNNDSFAQQDGRKHRLLISYNFEFWDTIDIQYNEIMFGLFI